MFSGGYFGGLCLTVLKTAAAEGVFSPSAASNISSIHELSTNEANNYANEQESDANILSKCFTGKDDAEKCHYIIDALIERAATLAAANLTAVVLKADKGRNPAKPLLLTIEGTTFYKLHNFKPLFEFYLNEHLSGERKRYVEFTKVDHSSLVGAALAALID